MRTNRDIFILMAGLGQRYKKADFATAKPLISFKGDALFIWAIRSVQTLLADSRLHLVICEEDGIRDAVLSELKKHQDIKAQIISLENRTMGPLDTALQALQKAEVSGNQPVIFCDCDLFIESKNWINGILRWEEEPYRFTDAFLNIYRSEEPRCSFVRTDEKGQVLEVAEKKVISDNAIAGFYAFKNAEQFSKSAKKVLKAAKSFTAEHYISQVYSEMIRAHQNIKIFKVDRIISFGTPEDLAEAKLST